MVAAGQARLIFQLGGLGGCLRRLWIRLLDVTSTLPSRCACGFAESDQTGSENGNKQNAGDHGQAANARS
jgi:hypothetical protein